MNPETLQDLRFRGDAPRSTLDIGAHVGVFTRGFPGDDMRPTKDHVAGMFTQFLDRA